MANFRIYRTNKDNKGVASDWQLSYKEAKKFNKYEMFLSIADQTGVDTDGNAKYGWDQAIVVKLGTNDVGEILAVLDGRQSQTGYNGKLFHQTPKGGNKVLSLTETDKGLYLRVSAQTEDKKNIGPYGHSITPSEAALLSALLKEAVIRLYEW